MRIDIQRLAPEGETFVGEEPASVWELEKEPQICADRPIHYEVRVFLVSGELIVNGRLESEVEFGCSRCDRRFRRTVRVDDFSCAREVDANDVTVDLTDEVRETMILAFPSYPVCEDGCRGLCAQCGANLNETTCGCRPPADRRWTELDKLQYN